jgi:hypothetical protein
MRAKGRVTLSFTNVLATLALFVALGGTSYAAIRVSSKQIKNGTVTSADLKNFGIGKTDLGKGLLESQKATPLNSIGYQAERDAGPTNAPNGDYVGVATLNLPPGPYVISAKANLSTNQLDAGRCMLAAGARTDFASRGLRSNGTPEALNMQVAYTFAGPGAVTLSCKSTDGPFSVTDSKILAVKVDSEQG